MKHYLTGFYVCLSLLFMPVMHAQYVLTCIAPPPQFSHDDLWNLTITRANTADNYAQFYLAMRIYNAQNQLELKTNSAVLALPDVLTVINLGTISRVQPFTMNYYNGGTLQQIIGSGGIFPPGTYNVDFTLYGRPSDGEFTELASTSEQVIVDAMWPPMLLSPNDGDSLQTPNPALTWTPAFSTYLSGAVSYVLRVVPIYTDQSRQQAIVSNLPQYTETNIPMPLQIYPNTAQPLEEGKRYAWQVEGRMGNSSLGYSEVWEFCYCFPEVPQSPASPQVWHDLQIGGTNNIYKIQSDSLRFKYTDQYGVSDSEKLKFTILNEATGAVIFDSEAQISYNFPTSKIYYSIAFDDLKIKNGTYSLIVENSRRQQYVMRFLYKR